MERKLRAVEEMPSEKTSQILELPDSKNIKDVDT
jgi:hypothetical protein